MSLFSESAMKILRKRYLLKDEHGQVVEEPESMLRRVAGFVASVEKDTDEWTQRFYEIMAGKRFFPNSPTLANAGKPQGQLAACFVLPVTDSVEGIFEAVKKASLIQKTGGGTGFSFSQIRPRGAPIRSTGGVASGPVPFISVFNCATEAVKQGGMRKGANMAVLDYWHPDLNEFIAAKRREGELTNFNFSVGVDAHFMSAISSNDFIDCIDPSTGKPNGTRVKANELFDIIVQAAWENGEPGILFFDHINNGNTIPGYGKYNATNPCGEQPLFDYESCNLGSLNLIAYLTEQKGVTDDKKIDWTRMKEDIHTAIRFLDDVIEVNYYVFPEIADVTRNNRKIGLGIMGFADVLIELGIPYASVDALNFIDKLMGFIKKTAREASLAIGKEKGPFPNINKSIFKGSFMRNATVTTIAPTGTISMLSGVSSGIEPLFGINYIKEALGGNQFVMTNESFLDIAQKRGFWSGDLGREIEAKGSLSGIAGIPEDVKKVFVTAFDIAPEWHVKVQAAFQRYVDNAVSKTINFPADATLEDVRKAYLLAWELGCKGVTIYRSESRENQVLKFADNDATARGPGVRCQVCVD